MMRHVLPAVAITIIVLGGAVLLLGGTNAGVWVLDTYAHARGGTWYQARFLCRGCSHRRHIGRTALNGVTLCTHCAPPGGTR